MTRPKTGRYPVSSFGPELMTLLIKASRERVEISCESMRQMKNLQMRIHMLRGAMNKEGHPQYALVTRVHTSCTWDNVKHPSTKSKQFPKDATDCKLVLYPKDSQFAAILEAAGIKLDDMTGAHQLLEEVAPPDMPADPSLEPKKPTEEPSEPHFNPDEIYGRFK